MANLTSSIACKPFPGITRIHLVNTHPNIRYLHPNHHKIDRNMIVYSTEISPSNDAVDTSSSALATSSDDANTSLTRKYEGYRSFIMDNCEFMITTTPSGELTLSNTFIVDRSTDSFERAQLHGDIPSHPQLYHEVEYAAEYSGNVLQDEEEEKWLLKVYLIQVKSTNPFRIDFENVFLLDSHDQSLSKLHVDRLAPLDTPEEYLRVRLRENIVTIDDARGLPDPEQVVQSHNQGVPAMSELEKKKAGIESPAGENGSSGNEDQALLSDGATTSAFTSSDQKNDPGHDPSTPDARGTDVEEATVEIVGAGNEGDDDPIDTGNDILYDDDTLKDFLVEVDDEADMDYDDYDMAGDEPEF